MTLSVTEDLQSKLERMAASRPLLGESESPKELVRWAVLTLEEEYVYVEPQHVRQLTGHIGTLKEIKLLIRECCAEKRQRSATSHQDSTACTEAFAVLARHARRTVEAELKEREDQLKEEAEGLAATEAKLKEAIVAAEDRERSAQDLKATLARELSDGREERNRLQAHVTEKDIQLASLSTELSDAQEQLNAYRDDVAMERERAAQASVEVHRVEIELAIRDAAIANAQSSMDEQCAEIGELRSKNALLNGDLRAAVKSLEAAGKRERQHEKQRARLESSLSQANSKLARERNQCSSYRDQLKVAQQQTTACQREVRNLTRELAISQKSRETEADALQSAGVRLEELRRELRRTRADLLRATRSSQQKPGKPSNASANG